MTKFSNGRETIGDHIRTLREGNMNRGGIQQIVTVPVGPPLLVNGATYNGVAFTAPCDGCYVKEMWLTAAVAMAGGTDTFAVDNYDKSASAARNALSTTNIDPTGVTAKKGTQLTTTTTDANLEMDEGDVLNFTLVCGTMTTAGQGYALTVVVMVPDVL